MHYSKSRLLRLCVPAAVAVWLCLAAAPSGAAAASCDTTDSGTLTPAGLEDSAGAIWDIGAQVGTADVKDGGLDLDGDHVVDRPDAYDGAPDLAISENGGANWTEYLADSGGANSGWDQCSLELGGRQVAFPVESIAGLDVSRKIYVPASGLAFARFLDVLHNPGSSPVTVDLDLFGGQANANLGSDSNTTLAASSAGHSSSATGDMSPLNADDSWATTWDGSPTGDPALAHNWQPALDTTGLDRADAVGTAVGYEDELVFQYNDVTIQPGATVAYMNFEAMRTDTAGALTAAKAIDAAPAAIVAGLTPDELSALRNWPGDADGDGVVDSVDNCPTVANADQADLDGDGIGDACDDDIDGDGLPNAVEAALGTNPRAVDSDGDGHPDGTDACPTLAGTLPNGCPAPAAGPAPDVTKAKIGVGGVPRHMTLKRFRKSGLLVSLAANEPVSYELALAARPKSVRLPRASDLVLVQRDLGRSDASRKVRLEVSRRLERRLHRRSTITLSVVATDAGGNQTTWTKRVRLT